MVGLEPRPVAWVRLLLPFDDIGPPPDPGTATASVKGDGATGAAGLHDARGGTRQRPPDAVVASAVELGAHGGGGGEAHAVPATASDTAPDAVGWRDGAKAIEVLASLGAALKVASGLSRKADAAASVPATASAPATALA